MTPAATIVHAVGASSSREDKLVLLLAGKTTFIRDHFHGAGRPLGLLCLRGGVALRSSLSGIARREARWSAAWRRRRDWLDGFPPRPAVATAQN